MNTSAKTESGLFLWREIFKQLFDDLITAFEKEYSLNTHQMKGFQLFGYDRFNAKEPNLKSFIDQKTGEWVNGKYLYLKIKEYEQGKELIKLNREFVHVYFRTLGFKHVEEYLHQSSKITAQQKQRQLTLLSGSNILAEEYYVGYYCDEQQTIIKSTLTLLTGNKEVEWKIYSGKEENREHSSTYRGIALYTSDRLTLLFNHKLSHSIHSDACICVFPGNTDSARPFMLGVFSAFDINNCPVAAEIIFKRLDNAELQEKTVLYEKVDEVIADRLLYKHITSTAIVPQAVYELSADSHYVHLLEKFTGTYTGYYITMDGNLDNIEIDIRPVTKTSYIRAGKYWILKGNFQIKNAGGLLVGVFSEHNSLQHVQVCILTAQEADGCMHGTISGIDTGNKPFTGNLFIQLKDEVLKKTGKDVLCKFLTASINEDITKLKEVLQKINQISNEHV